MTQHCPYCLNNKASSSYLEDTFFNGKKFAYLKCASCKVIYVNPLPIDDDYEKMYPSEYQGEIFNTSSSKYDDLFKKILEFNPKAKSILDYGCGNGELLINAQEFGFKAEGTEYNPSVVDDLNKQNPEIKFYTIQDFFSQTNLSYDMIVLNNVLEHLTNPNEILSLLSSKLSNEGLIVCLGPIENNFTIALLFRKMLFNFRKKILNKAVNHVPYHITFTNAQNQRMIFGRNNFEELYFKTDEMAWPFPNKIVFNSPKLFLFSIIAKISTKTSRLFNRNAGNIFTYIGKNEK